MAHREMTFDPVRQAQIYLRRAGRLLEGKSPETTILPGLDEDARKQLYDNGDLQITRLAARIEAYTGCTLDGRTALDFGCGLGRTALPLAERCEHVYGLDVRPLVLREADGNAKRRGLSNVEWMDAARLPELSGSYDLAISFWVLQHIPSREGERIFTTLVRGLRPNGVGALHVTLRPSFRDFNRSYVKTLTNSYSLNRLGRLLAEEGVRDWHARFHTRPMSAQDDVTLIFRKD